MKPLDQLVAQWPQPNSPSGICQEADWDRVYASLHVLPPPDYRKFLKQYGTGYVGINSSDPHWLVLYSPARTDGRAEFVEGFQTSIRHLNEFRRVSPSRFRWPILPEAGGIFPFAHDSCGFTYHWLTRGHPDDWKVLLDPDLGELENLEITFSELMLSLVQGRPAHSGFSEIDAASIVWTPEHPENLR